MSLLQFSNFAGNLQNDYLIGGHSGIMLRKVAGGFEVRSSDGSALATLEASYFKSSNAPTANDHMTNKLYVDGIESTAISTAASTAASLDVVVLSSATSTATSLDTVVLSSATSTANSLDVIVLSSATSTANSLDTIVLSSAVSTATSLDTIVQSTAISTAASTAASLDVVVLSSATSTANSLDVIVLSSATSTAVSLDTIVLSSATSTATSLDTVVQSTAISTAASTAASLDTIVLSSATSTANSLDVIVLSSATSTANSLDAIVLSSATSTANSLDVIVLSSATSTANSLDAIVLSSATSTATSLDAVVQSTAISTAASTAASLDAVVLSSATSTANSLDVVVLSSATSTANSLDTIVLSSAVSTATSLDAVVLSTANAYTDSVASGLNLHEAVKLATTEALPACTPAGSGVGKTLTADAVGVLSVDGIAVPLNARVLVKNQVDAHDNGIYTLTTLGDGVTNFVLTRATDFDGSPSSEVKDGSFFFVQEGNTLAGEGFVQITNSPVVDSTVLTFTQFSSAGNITAGNGLAKSGNTLSLDINNIATTITSAADSDMIPLADASDSLLTKKISKANLLSGIATANGLAKRIEVPVLLVDASSTTSIPVGARIEAVTVIVDTAYATAAATLQVSIDGSTPLIVAATTDSDTQFAAVYKSEPYSLVGVNNNGVVKVTVGGSPSGAGAATVIVQYVEQTLA